MKSILRKILVLTLSIAMLAISTVALAVDNVPVEIDLRNPEAQSFSVEWNGQPGTIVVEEAKRVGIVPFADYDLDEGIGTWTRKIYYYIGIWNISYTVDYTINSNYRVTINDIYGFKDFGVDLTFQEDKIVRANETGSYPAECFASWKANIGAGGVNIGQTITLRCRFQNRVLKVSLG